ncbi:MAG: cytochrome d ubiquinol oxidase subunit II [Acidiferrobacteraceae bacterium]
MIAIRHMLRIIWFLIVGLFLVFYVVLDGFELGVGILSLGAGREDRRTVMIASTSSIWDANESGLIVAARALFGAFPLAYAVIPSALYVPIIAMLFGLILSVVAFELHELSQCKHAGGLSRCRREHTHPCVYALDGELFIPTMIVYNAYQYLVFCGKVHADAHYGEGR